MKISFRNNVVGLSAETQEEQDICALLQPIDGHVFQLHASSNRGIAFSAIGPSDDARRTPLNIVRSVAPPFALISNLAHTPFVLDGVSYHSIEGFWQGLKSNDPKERRVFAMLSGAEAKGRGTSISQPPDFDYGGMRIATGSPEHWTLMRNACLAKFEQHKGARRALLATGERWLTHIVRKDSRTIPGVVMADIWMRIRDQLREQDNRPPQI